MNKKRNIYFSRHEVVLLKDLKFFLSANFSDRITIKGLSVKLNINQSKLKSGFRRFHGQSLHQYLIQVRMGAAVEFLKTGKPLKEIAKLCGYSSQQNFSTAFKKYFGHSPGQRRQEENN
jgi:AraC-like DNA-binding protein